jgi:hypothetical protein
MSPKREHKNRDAQGDGDEGTGTNRPTTSETASGAEAARGMEGKPKGESQNHRSAYGGDGGEPKEPNDFPRSRR